ncbi:WD40 repeat domain-containing protein [Prochlorothrix hollandica]|uniref:WD40 repeat domain-containing protein n=1 Tax=Prochlorothrix hollandica TaxID=1223 RepID=UPI003341C100
MTRLALVVGIDTYQTLPALPIARTGATAIAQRLERYGQFTVQQLPVPLATAHPGVSVEHPLDLASLKENLIELFQPQRGVYPKTALFYFSGYGFFSNGGLQEGFLATSDCYSSQDHQGLSFFWLQRLLRDSPVEQWAVWLDCWQPGGESLGLTLGSHGSTIADNSWMDLKEADPGGRNGHDRLFLAASQPVVGLTATTTISLNTSGSLGFLGQSLSPLTQAIAEGLDPDRTDTGVITSAFLHNWVRSALDDRLPNHHWHQSGNPIVLSRALRDFCPYKGLAYFDCNTDDPQYFHGRDSLTVQLLEAMVHHPFLAVLGASGSGKSSVLRAGLIHQLQLGQMIPDSDRWRIHIVQPGGHPLLNLAFAFLDLNLPLVERAKQLGEIETFLSQGREGMRRLIQASAAPRLVLVVDQFEELFTLCRDKAERLLFLDCLLGAIALAAEGRYGVPFHVVIGMRADFFSQCTRSDYAALGEAIRHNHVTVPALTPGELQDAICKPAQQLGVTLEPELIQQMIADVAGASNALPLLEYTLTELWHQRRDRQLQVTDYIRLGGIRGTLEKRADALYQQLNPEEQSAVQHIFLSLTQFGDGVTEDSRRRVFKQDLTTPQFSPRLIDSTLQRLANEKLVVTSAWAPPGTGLGEEEVVDVIHEALIRHWGLLRHWIETHRDDLRQQRELQEQAEQWFRKGKAPDYLLQGEALREALTFWLQWTEDSPTATAPAIHRPLSGLVQELLDASQQAQQQRHQVSQQQQQQFQQQRHQTQRAKLQLRTLALGAGGVLCGALLLIAAQRQAIDSQTIGSLTTEVRQALVDHQDLESQRLSLEAHQRWRTNLLTQWFQPSLGESVEAGLQQALYETHELNQVGEHGGGIVSVALNPQGVSPQGLGPSLNSPPATAAVSAPEASPVPRPGGEGSNPTAFLATSGRDGRVQLWDSQGQKLAELAQDQGEVYEVAWSPDGLKLATAGRDGTVRLWNAQGQPLVTLEPGGVVDPSGTRSPVFDVAWSPDSRELISTGSDGQVYRWSGEGTLLGQFKAHDSWIYDVVYNPTGQRLATAGGDGLVKLWDLDGNLQGTLDNDGSTVWSVAFSPDGQTLASASSDSQIRLWDRQGQLLRVLQGHRDRVLSVRFSPDGQTLASGSTDGTIHLWDLQGHVLQVFQGHGDWVYDLAYSAQGDVLVSSGRDGTARFWRLTPPVQQQQLAHPDRTLKVAYDPLGEFVATSSTNGSVSLWSSEGQPLKTLTGHQGWVLDLNFSADGQRLVTGGSDGMVRIWSRSGQLLHTLPGDQGWVYEVAFSPDGAFIASRGRSGTVRLWTAQGQLLGQLSDNVDANGSSPIYSLLFSPDGTLLATRSQDNGVRLWQLPTREASTSGSSALSFPVTLLKDHQGEIYDMAFTPDSEFVATAGADGTVRLWDLQGKPRSVLRSNSAEIYSLSISGDGQTLATGSSDGSTRLWTLDGQVTATLPTAQEPVWEVRLSPDGKTLATRSNSHTARLWDVATGQAIVELPPHGGSVWSLRFSPDSQTLVTHSADGVVQLWNRQGQRQAILQNTQGQVTSVSADPQAKLLASGGSDGSVRLWDSSGALVATLTGHQGAVEQVAFSPDGKTLASTSTDGTVRLWNRRGELLQDLGSLGSAATYGVAFDSASQQVMVSDAQGMVRRWSVTGEALGEFKADTQPVLALAWSRDGQQVATGQQDGTVKLWDLTGQPLETRSGHQDRVTSLIFRDQGQLASSSADGTVRLWNAAGESISTLRGHQGTVRQVQFHPHAPQLLTSGEDGTVRLWNDQGQALVTIPAHGGGVGTAQFSADGQTVISGGWHDGQWRRWAMGDGTVLARSLCQQLQSYLHNPTTPADQQSLCDAFL